MFVRNLILSSDRTRICQDVMSFAYVNGEGFIEELKQKGSKAYLVPHPRKKGYGPFSKEVLKIMKDGQYDVVHCHMDGWRSSMFRKLAKKAKIKLFCTHAHRTTNDPGLIKNNKLYLRINEKISCANADIKFACGMDAGKFINGKTKDIVEIPNGIDLERCHTAEKTDQSQKKESLGIGELELVLLQVGRLVGVKNHAFMIEIADQLRKKGIAFKILVAGTGELQQTLEEKVREKNLADFVHFLGRRDDIYELMAISDLMLLPSFSEGLPTVVVEAQAMGLGSLISDTITKECDQGLGLIRFLPINQGAKIWSNAIASYKKTNIPDRAYIDEKMIQNAYTSYGAAEKYYLTLENALNKC